MCNLTLSFLANKLARRYPKHKKRPVIFDQRKPTGRRFLKHLHIFQKIGHVIGVFFFLRQYSFEDPS